MTERGAQSRWSAPGLCPCSFVKGRSDCWALHKEHRRALNRVSRPSQPHLLARLKLHTVKSIIIALKYKSAATQIFKSCILKELLYKGNYLQLSALYLDSTCRFILSVLYYFDV